MGSRNSDSKASEETDKVEIEQKFRDISSFNGGMDDKLVWSQDIHTVTVQVDLPKVTKPKELIVDLQSKKISVKYKQSGEVVIEGEWCQSIKVGDSFWSVESEEDKSRLQLNLDKLDERIWSCVVKGGKEIDTKNVENTKDLGEFDGETQGAVRKLWWDEQQKRQGKPTSDQLKMQDVMKNAWNAEGSPFKGTPFDPSKIEGAQMVGDWNK